MPRPKDDRPSRRFKFRIDASLIELCDGYSIAQLNEIFNQGLRTIDPDSPLGAVGRVLVRPQSVKTATVARVVIKGRVIRVTFPEKRDDFRAAVIEIGYSWQDGCWQRTIAESDDLADRAAELVNQLLCAGFCVQVDHSEVRERAIAATYKPECFRVVRESQHRTYPGWFEFSWPRNEDWYSEISSLACAKYSDGALRVPPEQFAEVEDFAEQNDFELTPEAIAILEQAKAEWEAALIVTPRSAKRKSKKAKNPIENVEVEVPSALIDDDA